VEVLTRVANAFAAWCIAKEVRSPLLPAASNLRRAFAGQLWYDAGAGEQLLQLVSVGLMVAVAWSRVEAEGRGMA
jgi:hypothetical protein